MNRRLLYLVAGSALAATLLVAGGCGGKKKLPEGTLALVNEKAIALTDVKKVFKQFKRQNFTPDTTSRGATPEERLYYTALDRLVEQELIVQHALAAGVQVTDAEVTTSVEQLKNMAGGEEKFRQLLTMNEATEADVFKDMKQNLVVQGFLDKRRNEVKVTDEALHRYYDENAQQFGPTPQVHAWHVLIRTRPDMTDMEKAEALRRAQAVQTKAQAGADFGDLATKNSEDPSAAQNHGDLGWFGHGDMVPQFEDAAFALHPGEVSKVVETQFGYHVIKQEGTRAGEAKPFDDVKEGIRNFLSQQELQGRFKAVIDSLRAAGKVQIQDANPEILTALGS